jgi:hypothetical protein
MNAELIPNPFVTVWPAREGDEIVSLTMTVPVKGRGLMVSRYGRQDVLFALLLRVAEGGDEVELEVDERDFDRLAEAGFLVRADQVPEPVPCRCDLPQADGSAVPEGAIVHPSYAYHPAPPASLFGAALSWNHYQPGGPLVSVRDPRHEIGSLFWVDGLPELAALVPGQPAQVAPELRARLWRAGLLTVPEALFARAEARADALAAAAAQYRRVGHAALPGLVDPHLLAALARYYRKLVAEGLIKYGDVQVPERYVMGNEGAARFLHHQLAPLIARLTGEAIKPSYCYVACYTPGSLLYKHVDRKQCEFSITFAVDYQPEPAGGENPWPLYLETQAGEVTEVRQRLGDGLLYKGRELWHYRPVLPPGQRSTHIFFHYVRADFDGPLV